MVHQEIQPQPIIMFKYKDLRMVAISIILVILCVFSGIHFRYDRMKLVVVLLLALGVLPTLLIRFNASVFEDGLLVYFFKGIGFMPQMIEFKDLTAYSLNSKHRIELQFNNHTKNIYLVNATSFYEELDKKFNQYKKWTRDLISCPFFLFINRFLEKS